MVLFKKLLRLCLVDPADLAVAGVCLVEYLQVGEQAGPGHLSLRPPAVFGYDERIAFQAAYGFHAHGDGLAHVLRFFLGTGAYLQREDGLFMATAVGGGADHFEAPACLMRDFESVESEKIRYVIYEFHALQRYKKSLPLFAVPASAVL